MASISPKLIQRILSILIVADIAVWFFIFYPLNVGGTQLYFLDVGQGDSSLVILPGGAKILIDGGPMNGRLQKNLEAILPLNDRYIDLVMVSHASLDHFGGLLDIFRNYHIGAVLTTAYNTDNKYWKEFEKMIKEKKIPRIIITEGDRIVQQDSQFDILSPASSVKNVKDLNDVAIATILQSSGLRAFFGSDIGVKTEQGLARKYDVNIDVLKVSHHGSKFSSDPLFLQAASPIFAMITVGKNSYGHPTKEALGRLRAVGAKIFRTDISGFIKVVIDAGRMQVYTQK